MGECEKAQARETSSVQRIEDNRHAVCTHTRPKTYHHWLDLFGELAPLYELVEAVTHHSSAQLVGQMNIGGVLDSVEHEGLGHEGGGGLKKGEREGTCHTL